MAYVVIQNIKLRAKPTINQDFQINAATKGFIGSDGSYTNITGSGGRKLEIPVHAKADDIQKIQDLRKQKKPVTLVSQSAAKYNGKYYITDLKTGERKKNIFDVTISLQEYTEYNITRKTFANWKKSTSKTSTKTTSSTIKALNKCPTLRYGNRSECVKTIQKALKRCGYYVSVNGHALLLDSWFGPYTQSAVKAFQKKKKIKVDGIVGPVTKAKLSSC
jgi:hypothetical protein